MTKPSITLQAIIDVLNGIAPFYYAEDWDNTGLMIGNPKQIITGILIGLDPTLDLLCEAQDVNANLIITHHPAIFHPLKSIQLDQPTSAFIAKAIKNDIAVIACHTNLDVVQNGVNDSLAKRINLVETTALIASKSSAPAIGLGLTGRLPSPLKAKVFFSSLCHKLNLTSLHISGSIPNLIERVALCGGSGSELAPLAQKSGAQVFITGEIKHSTARWAEEIGFCVVDAGHFGTENTVVPELAESLTRKLNEPETPVFTSIRQQSPFTLFTPYPPPGT